MTTSIREIKINMLEKFDGRRLKFWGFLQEVKLYFRLHLLQHFNRFIQVTYESDLNKSIRKWFMILFLSKSVLFWFAPLIENDSWLLYDLNSFIESFIVIFEKSYKKE